MSETGKAIIPGSQQTNNPSAPVKKDIVNGHEGVYESYVNQQQRNRHRSSVAGTREKVTWTTDDNILEVTILVMSAGTAAANDISDTVVAFCFNAPNYAIADAWLTETDTEADDVQHVLVPIGVPKTVRFNAENPLTRCDFIRIDGTPTCRVMIEAA